MNTLIIVIVSIVKKEQLKQNKPIETQNWIEQK